jgi:hypothetical protein
MHTILITQDEQQAIARAFADFELILCRDQYRLDRAQYLELNQPLSHCSREALAVLGSRREWNLARKRVNELEKEVCK